MYVYCIFNEETNIATCYFPDKICTYYPDGSVNCVPKAFPWSTLVAAILFITLSLISYLLFVR